MRIHFGGFRPMEPGSGHSHTSTSHGQRQISTVAPGLRYNKGLSTGRRFGCASTDHTLRALPSEERVNEATPEREPFG